VSAFAPISFLADADDVYSWCRAVAEDGGRELPAYVREFFNRQIPAVASRIAELESRPVSAPPAVPGSRDFYQRPQDILGHNAIAQPQLADDLPTAQAHLSGDHRLCSPSWCTSVIPLRVEQIDDEIKRRSAEAGIEPEDGPSDFQAGSWS